MVKIPQNVPESLKIALAGCSISYKNKKRLSKISAPLSTLNRGSTTAFQQVHNRHSSKILQITEISA